MLGALCLVVAFQRFTISRARSLELAGKYSLGLYVVHKWVWYPLALLAAGVSVSRHVEYFVPIAVAALAIALSCLLVALLSRTPARFIVTSDSRGGPRPARQPSRPRLNRGSPAGYHINRHHQICVASGSGTHWQQLTQVSDLRGRHEPMQEMPWRMLEEET